MRRRTPPKWGRCGKACPATFRPGGIARARGLRVAIAAAEAPMRSVTFVLAVVLGFAVAPDARAQRWVDDDLGGAPASPPAVAVDGERRGVYFEGTHGHLWVVRREGGAAFA